MMKALISLISKLSKREKVIFSITVFLIFSLIVNRLILSPALLKIKELDKKISEQEKTIQNSLLMLSREQGIIAEHGKYAPYFEKAESKSEEPILFLKSIENLAKNSSVELLDIKPAPSREGDLTKEYFISLSCEAKMEQIFDFLYSIESSEELLNVERIHITAKEERTACSIYVSKVLILPR